MGYKDDFYQKSNIIGYTGNKMESEKLTVYFQDGNKFGRITQYYPDDDANVGRSEVREYADYRIYNKDEFAVEYYDGQVQHESRNKFVPVPQSEYVTINTLSQAISRCKDLKPKYQK
jgi:hypothetical protein